MGLPSDRGLQVQVIIILQRPFLARQALFGVNATNGERVSPSASFLILGAFIKYVHTRGEGGGPKSGNFRTEGCVNLQTGWGRGEVNPKF